MLREKSADTYMPASYGNFEVEGGDIAPATWINEFDATLLKPLVFYKKCVNPKKRAEGIREFCNKLKHVNEFFTSMLGTKLQFNL